MPGQRVAYVIGNQRYQHLPNLQYCEKNVKGLAAILEKRGRFQVSRLIDANKSDLESMIKWMVQSLKANGDFLFYFTGHGVAWNGNQYLVPIDGTYELGTWVSLEELVQPMIDSASGRETLQGVVQREHSATPATGARLVIICDCCRTLPDPKPASSVPPLLMSTSDTMPPTSYGKIFDYRSDGKVEKVRAHAVFTNELLEVLKEDHVGLNISGIYKEVAEKHSENQWSASTERLACAFGQPGAEDIVLVLGREERKRDGLLERWMLRLHAVTVGVDVANSCLGILFLIDQHVSNALFYVCLTAVMLLSFLMFVVETSIVVLEKKVYFVSWWWGILDHLFLVVDFSKVAFGAFAIVSTQVDDKLGFTGASFGAVVVRAFAFCTFLVAGGRKNASTAHLQEVMLQDQ